MFLGLFFGEFLWVYSQYLNRFVDEDAFPEFVYFVCSFPFTCAVPSLVPRCARTHPYLQIAMTVSSQVLFGAHMMVRGFLFVLF